MTSAKVVMVVDDDRALRESVCELLEDDGYTAVAMPSGAAALARLKSTEQKPDLVLLDLMMPGMTGWQFRERQLADPELSRIRVVVMTANRETHDIPADAVVLKPLKLDRLLRVVIEQIGPTVARPAAPSADAHDRVIESAKLVASARDAAEAPTARAATEETFAARDESAKAADAALGERIVGLLSHELRNPLAAIIAAADLLDRRDRDERTSAPVQRIRASADRMNRMIAQIVDVSRSRLAGGIPIDPRETDLAPVAEALVAERSDEAARRFVLHTSGDTKGEWDRARIAQALDELIANAVEHGEPTDPIRITVDGSQARTVRIEIRNGGAMDPELRQTLFDPLRGAKPSSPRGKPKGLGLGLFVVDRIVRAHGGRIEVTSSEDDGTRVRVYLPRRTE